MNYRIIPRLDIKGPNLVKGIQFEGLRVLGKPEQFARFYYEQGADELLYMDAVASLYGRNSLLDIISSTARDIFIPLCVGGGLRTVQDIQTVLRAGADKVSINTAAIESPDLIRQASRSFGSSTIVVSIEAVKQPDGRYLAFTNYGREKTGVEVIEWAHHVVELGAGELIVTAIDREGTGKGFDLDLTRRIADSVSVPVIAAGGAGTVDHIVDVILEGHADAVCLASMLHYNFIEHCAVNEAEFVAEGNIEFLQGKRGARASSKIEDRALPEIKHALREKGIPTRE